MQATALAPTALEAEVLAKAAVLERPGRAPRAWLPHGGVVVLDDGTSTSWSILRGNQPGAAGDD